MKTKVTAISILTLAALAVVGLFLMGNLQEARAYPPAVGIVGKSKDCLVCHLNNGPWKDDAKTIIDIIDKDTKKSYKQPDGNFLIVLPSAFHFDGFGDRLGLNGLMVCHNSTFVDLKSSEKPPIILY